MHITRICQAKFKKAARSEVIFVDTDQEFEHNKIKIEGKDYGLYTADNINTIIY